MKNEIIIFENQNIKLEVNLQKETVWLTQKQIAILFEKDENTINDHIKNIFLEGELEKETSTGISGKSFGGRKAKTYNLDVIISVGYRVKSKNGIIFRQWANKILRDYLIQGYAINNKRLEYLEKTIKIIDIANRIDEKLENKEAKEILNIIGKYTKALNMLDNYDHKKTTKPKGTKNDQRINYDECLELINILKTNQNSTIFALERDNGLEGIIKDIYQTYECKELYPTVEEKAANFLYMIVKNHVFIDGNKRIAATLFIYFLFKYEILYINDKQIIDNNTLTAMTLLIAESNPKEKEVIIDLILNFFNN